MKFEFDTLKSNSNFRKHGISFDEAKELWEDIVLLELPARDVAEPRILSIGMIKSKHWSAITTLRGSTI